MRKIVIGLILFCAAVLAAAEIPAPHRSKVPSAREPALPASTSSAVNSLTGSQAEAVPKAYWTASDLIVKNQWDKARSVLQTAMAEEPDNYHLHKLLAELNWYFYADRTHADSDLTGAAKEAKSALELSLAKGAIDYPLVSLAADLLGREADTATLDLLFSELLARDKSYGIYLDYAHALALANDPRAEEFFKDAAAHEADGAPNSRAQYSEWLLRQGRSAEVVSLTDSGDAGLAYLSFLRGVALENLGRLEEARKAYTVYAPYSKAFPAPVEFQFPKSEIQKQSGIQFTTSSQSAPKTQSLLDSLTPKALADSQAIQGLSYLVHGEAPSESQGGMRAEGWVARNRVVRGTASGGCPSVTNTGATLGDQYKSVMCQGNGSQFNGMCLAWCANPSTTACSGSGTYAQVAYDVFYGLEPDPVAGYCPSGTTVWGGSYCDPRTRCVGDTKTYLLSGGLFNYGTPGSCPANCAPSVGKVCSNGNSDNCFYVNSSWSGKSYSGYLSATSSHWYDFQPNGTYYYSQATTQRGHLEGPPASPTSQAPYNPNFNLVLFRWNGSSWQQVAGSFNPVSVEEVVYNGSPGYYIWEVYAGQGSGSYTLKTSNP